MPDLEELRALASLAWLVEAGADEAIGEAPVNRFQAKAHAQTSPSPLAGEGNASRSNWEGGKARARTPPPPSSFAARPLPQGDGGSVGARLESKSTTPRSNNAPRASITPTSVLNTYASDNDHIGRAMEIANACTSLPELKAALEAFEGCALKKFASTTVFADGNPEARIIFIGEAPGYEEDRTGLPFVGKAGKLLDKMLAAIGLDRTTAYIINVVPWRPPDNRTLELTEVAKCLPFLRRHIELHAPELIMLLGATPLKHVLGITEGIMRARGKWLQYHVSGRMVPAMPTLHPAYLLRQPAHKRFAWRDLLAIDEKIRASELLEHPVRKG